MKQIKLITHSGIGHADDLFAYSVLNTVFPENELIRTRDYDAIFPAQRDKIVFDVGMIYNPDLYLFDHHQKDKHLREDGIPYSSFGLIWENFGIEYLGEIGISLTHIGEVWKYVDKEFVREVDISDNGVNTDITKFLTYKSNYFNFIKYMFVDETDEEFLAASVQTTIIFRNFCLAAEKKFKDIALADIALASYDGNGILVLDAETSATTHIAKNESIKYIISPRKDEWQLYAISIATKSFVCRKNLLAVAAGLTGDALITATGIPDLVFCHSGRFFAVGKTKESVLELARQSLEE